MVANEQLRVYPESRPAVLSVYTNLPFVQLF